MRAFCIIILTVFALIFIVKIAVLQHNCAPRDFTDINKEEQAALKRHFGITVSDNERITRVIWRYDEALFMYIGSISDLGDFIIRNYEFSLDTDEIHMMSDYLRGISNREISITTDNNSNIESYENNERWVVLCVNSEDNTDAADGGDRTNYVTIFNK